MTTITILGNNSGRNAGDNAILGNLLRDVSAELPQAEFLVPTTNPGFIRRHFGQFKVKPMGLLPWNGCIKNLGWPLCKAMTAADAVLICDNILFDRNLYNPLFNYLSSVALFAPFCKKRGFRWCSTMPQSGRLTGPQAKEPWPRSWRQQSWQSSVIKTPRSCWNGLPCLARNCMFMLTAP